MENTGPPPLLRTCPACKSRIEPDHEFCEICGAKMPALPACSNCGARFIAPVKFCEMCGTPVKPQGSPAAVQEERAGPVNEPGLPPRGQPAVRREITTPLPPAPELPPYPEQPAVTKEIAAPIPRGPEEPGTDDDVLFFIPGDTVPAKPAANRARVIGGIVLLVVIIAALAFIALPILHGNGGPGAISKPAAAAITPLPDLTTTLTTQPTPTPTLVPTTAFGPLVPLPTQSLPAGQKVYFQVQKDPVSGKISVIFAGSAIANSVTSAEVTVTQPGGAIGRGIILPAKSVLELTLAGTRGVSDRVEILAKMTNGQTYRVYDAMVK
jgi:hypothetical protein